MRAPWGTAYRVTALLAFLLVVVLPAAREARHQMGVGDDPRHASYQAIADWISSRYPGSRVAATEVGYLGWYGDFETVDLLGLVTPQALPEALRRGRLRPTLRALDPDLLLLPCGGGGMQPAILGRPRTFWRRWRLTALFPEHGHALFRRRGLPARGEIVVDLLAAQPAVLADGIVYAQRGALLLPTLRLAASSSLRLRLPAHPSRLVVYGTAALPTAGDRQIPRLTLRAGDRAATFPLDAGDWTVASLPVRASAGSVELVCRAGGECLVALPHLVRDDSGATRARRTAPL